MALSIREAGREAGVSKSTILRVIQRGRLSAGRGDDGNYCIDAAEVFRVYPPRAEGQDAHGSAPPADTVLRTEIEGLRAQLALMRESIDDLVEREKKAGARADRAEERADKADARADRLLVDQRRKGGFFGWLKG